MCRVAGAAPEATFPCRSSVALSGAVTAIDVGISLIFPPTYMRKSIETTLRNPSPQITTTAAVCGTCAQFFNACLHGTIHETKRFGRSRARYCTVRRLDHRPSSQLRCAFARSMTQPTKIGSLQLQRFTRHDFYIAIIAPCGIQTAVTIAVDLGGLRPSVPVFDALEENTIGPHKFLAEG
jgi:hypothetical protein